ncbi:MAG: hypothetical protein ACRDJ9_06440 [Dehalococcoidia bacterium]
MDLLRKFALPFLLLGALLVFGVLVAGGAPAGHVLRLQGSTGSDESACEAQATRIGAESWFCNGAVLIAERPGSSDRTMSRLGQNLEAPEPDWDALTPEQEALYWDGTALPGASAALQSYDMNSSDNRWENPDPPYKYKINDRIYYGSNQQGTIGRFGRSFQVTMNGRQANFWLWFTRLSGPRLNPYLHVECRDTNGWRPDTNCGHFHKNPGWTSSTYYSGIIYGNRLTDDSIQYYGVYFSPFYAEGYRNPSTETGEWYPPGLRTHPWDCSGSTCRFH